MMKNRDKSRFRMALTLASDRQAGRDNSGIDIRNSIGMGMTKYEEGTPVDFRRLTKLWKE
jgi:hypothetical protein